jgi:RND family efflux transporter MFP subunit
VSDDPKPDQRTEKRDRLPVKRLALGVGIPVAVLIAVGALGRIETDRAADQTVDITAMVPTVAVATAERDDKPVTVSLPGQTESFDTASLYPRATGYVAERRVDIGSRVHKGDLLLRIAAPDTDAQLDQAVATIGQLQAAILQAQFNLKQAEANRHLADITSARSSTLAKDGWTPVQTADNDSANKKVQKQTASSAQAGIAVAEANLHAQQASVERLRALVGFEQVTAPFDGVVTARNIDVGDLLQADSTNGGSPMFTVVSDDVLRAEVYVPQSEAVGVTNGIPATVTLPELPGRVFHATVSRSAVAVADASRSMQTEIDIPNKDHVLRPGLYINISFKVPRPHPVVTIPDAAVIFNGDGLQVATVEDGRARFRHITIEHDLGTIAELSTGLHGGEQVIVSPPSDLVDGAKVHVPADQNHEETASAKSPPV